MNFISYFLTLTFFLTPFVFNTALAKTVHILCPKPESLRFERQDTQQTWNRYKVSGREQILKGDYPPFQMTGVNPNNTVTTLLGADYTDDAFLCDYHDKTHSWFVLVDGELARHYKHCTFKNGDPGSCEGTPKNCELICHDY